MFIWALNCFVLDFEFMVGKISREISEGIAKASCASLARSSSLRMLRQNAHLLPANGLQLNVLVHADMLGEIIIADGLY